MDRRTVLSALSLALTGCPVKLRAQSATERIDFSPYAVGALPPDFLGTWRTGQGAVGDWRVVEDPTATQGKAIEQASVDPTDYRFPLAVYEPQPVQNADVSVCFKAITGTVDRAGGLAIRLTDADNYYVVRANALEGNVNLYRVLKGRRQQIAGAPAKVSSGEWHALALRAEGVRLASPTTASPCSQSPITPSPASAKSPCGRRRTA
jgi:hypothetical protein